MLPERELAGGIQGRRLLLRLISEDIELQTKLDPTLDLGREKWFEDVLLSLGAQAPQVPVIVPRFRAPGRKFNVSFIFNSGNSTLL
jgi:hypothetical protein